MTHSKHSMKRTAGFTFILAFLFGLTMLAKDFWEEKPFTAWSEKEAHRILSDSPWSKTEHLALPDSERQLTEPRERAGSIPSPGASPAGAGRATGGDGNLRGDQGAGRVPVNTGGSYGGEAGSANQSVPFQVTWYSSMKVRQAMGRLGQLQGNISAEQVSAFVQQPAEDYIVAVSGPLMMPLEQASLESLKGRTFLLSKKDKNKKLELKEYVPSKDRKDNLALFVFPRTVDGKPSLDVADEEVQFVAELVGLKIKTAFKLSKMMTDGKLDI